MNSPAAEQQDTAYSTSSFEQLGSGREIWLIFAGLTALYVLAIAIGNHRYVWYDELFTFDIARSASLHQLWSRELKFDNHTPAMYLLSRLSMAVFGPSKFGLRFPSMAEFYIGSVAVLFYVRRKTNPAFAALAVLMLWTVAPTLYFAVEARPYALIFGSFACLLLSWDSAIRVHSRGIPLFAIALSTFAMSAAHVFAPFILFAFVVAEAVRFWRRRKPDYALWAALLLPMLVMAIYIPLIRVYGGVVFNYTVQASFRKMGQFFEGAFNTPILFFAVMAALLAPIAKRPKEVHPRYRPEEFALLACLLLSPILLNLVLMHRQGAFYDRYGIATQAAILVALTIFLAYHLRLNRVAAWAASLVLLLSLLKLQVWHPLSYPVPANAAILESVKPKLPIVVGEGMVFMEMNHYEGANVMSRLYFLKDAQASMRYAHSNFFETFEAPDDMRAAGFPFPANIASYSGFVTQHRQFLFLGSHGEWVFIKLLLEGASIAYVGDYAGAMPYRETTVYLVTMPRSTDSADLLQ